MDFDFKEAFKRNLGLVSPDELQKLRTCRVALPGMGGVGGSHLIQLTRAGIGKFHIADFDEFDLGNFNRQYGAMMSTIGQAKTSVMKKMALDVNPELDLKSFDKGVKPENIEDFLSGVDILIDTIDIYQQKMRRFIINEAYKRNIPVITCGPISFGTAYLTILPKTVSYDDFLAINDNMSEEETLIHFLVVLTPQFYQMKYYLTEYIDIKAGAVPSSPAGISLSSGVTVTETLKILLNRRHLLPVPYVHHFDAYLNKYSVTKLSWGNNSWLQKIKINKFKKFLDTLN